MNSADPNHVATVSPSLFPRKPGTAVAPSQTQTFRADNYRGTSGSPGAARSSGVSSLSVNSPMVSTLDYAWGLDNNDFNFLNNLPTSVEIKANETKQPVQAGSAPAPALYSSAAAANPPAAIPVGIAVHSVHPSQLHNPLGTGPPPATQAHGSLVQVQPVAMARLPQAGAKGSSAVARSSPLAQVLPDLKRESLPRSKVRPCDHCRRRKTKCVIIPTSSSCVQCQTKELRCMYSDATMKRTIGLLEEDPKRRCDSTSPTGNLSFKEYAFQQPAHPIREVHPVTDYSTVPNLLLKRTLSLQYPRSSFYVGPTSIFDAGLLNQIRLDKIDSVQLSAEISLRKVGENVQFTLRDDYTDALLNRLEQDVDAVERLVAPHGRILIDLYFRIIHPSFPILHKKVFFEKYGRTHREFSALLLAAVYILAIQWWEYDPQLSQFPKPDLGRLNVLAIRAFSDVIERPKLSAVQAGLLLLQCRPDHARNWVMCLQVVAIAEELGLGLDCSGWRLPKWERGLRRRLAWAVFMQDKWLSLTESRPSHIAIGRDWLVQPVSEEDFPDVLETDLQEGLTDIENGKHLFREMISLTIIVSEILDTLFTMHAMKTVTRIDHVLRLAKPLQLKLRNWYHSLPPVLHMSTVHPRKLCPNGYLQLAYFSTEITLHRKIIGCLPAGSPRELVNVCRTAARTRLLAAVEYVRELRPEHIHAFWHSSATANFALIGTFATILYHSAPSPQEAAFFKDQIFNYRWTLRVSSKSFDQAAMALEKLDMMLLHIPGLLSDAPGLVSPGPLQQQPLLSFSAPSFSLYGYGESPPVALQPKQAIQQQLSTEMVNSGTLVRPAPPQRNSSAKLSSASYRQGSTHQSTTHQSTNTQGSNHQGSTHQDSNSQGSNSLSLNQQGSNHQSSNSQGSNSLRSNQQGSYQQGPTHHGQNHHPQSFSRPQPTAPQGSSTLYEPSSTA